MQDQMISSGRFQVTAACDHTYTVMHGAMPSELLAFERRRRQELRCDECGLYSGRDAR